MVKWGPVVLGFILALIIKTYFASYELIGLILIGFLVGYIAHDGALGGLWHAALAGAFGTIVAAVIYIILITAGSTALVGIFGGIMGFTFAGLTSLVVVLLYIVYYALVMGIAGAVAGAISEKR